MGNANGQVVTSSKGPCYHTLQDKYDRLVAALGSIALSENSQGYEAIRALKSVGEWEE